MSSVLLGWSRHGSNYGITGTLCAVAHLLHLLGENQGEGVGLGTVVGQGGIADTIVGRAHELVAQHLHALHALHVHEQI